MLEQIFFLTVCYDKRSGVCTMLIENCESKHNCQSLRFSKRVLAWRRNLIVSQESNYMKHVSCIKTWTGSLKTSVSVSIQLKNEWVYARVHKISETAVSLRLIILLQGFCYSPLSLGLIKLIEELPGINVQKEHQLSFLKQTCRITSKWDWTWSTYALLYMSMKRYR